MTKILLPDCNAKYLYKTKLNLNYRKFSQKQNMQTILPSHIIDLINDIIRERKHFEPRGWQTFSRGLKEVNVPQDIVGKIYK